MLPVYFKEVVRVEPTISSGTPNIRIIEGKHNPDLDLTED